jgi:Flp pilus assembly protein TadG
MTVDQRPAQASGTSRRLALRGQDGQSLVLVILAMVLLMAMAALAVDVSEWYQKRHQAQVSADASALAAASCLARHVCTSASASGDAGMTATTYAKSNGVTIPSGDISFDSTNDRVTVTTATAAPITFAGLFSLHPNVSAVAVASYAPGQIAYSFFSENSECAPTGSTGSLGLWVNEQGGGNGTILGMYANGEYFNANSSGSAYYLGSISSASTCGSGLTSHCSKTGPYTQSCWQSTSTDLATTPPVLYPTCYSEPGTTTTPTSITQYCATAPPDPGPTCIYSPDNYWTTDPTKGGTNSQDLITSPPPSGSAYCVGNNGSSSTALATTASGGCNNPSTSSTQSDGTAGSIYIDRSLSGSGYEFAGPCVVFNYPGNAGSVSVTPPTTQPLVYGTANTQSTGTPDIYVSTPNSGTSSMGTLFDPLGTVSFYGNNAFLGFVEAMNIQVNANNNVTGTGPIANNQPGVDLLTN